MGSRFDYFNTMRSFQNSFDRVNSITRQFSYLDQISISKIGIPSLGNYTQLTSLAEDSLLSEQIKSTSLASQTLSNFQLCMPGAAELNSMSNTLIETAKLAENNNLALSVPELLKINETLVSSYKSHELLNVNNAIVDFAQLQSTLPTVDDVLKVSSLLPSTVELNKHFLQIRNNSISGSDFISSIKDKFSNYFNFEDVFHETYFNLYKNIDINEDSISCNEDNIFELNINYEDESVPLVNQKDIYGLIDIFSDITKKEAIDFINHLSKYPYLGSIHKTGIKIRNELKNKIDNLTRKIEDTTLYRARIWSDKQELDYTIQQMWQAPYGVTPMGRFNPVGINYLYMSNSSDTAKNELKNDSNFTIMKTDVKADLYILDLSKYECIIFELCNKRKYDSSTNPQEYLLPNYIAQCCSYLSEGHNKKIDGLRYKSSLTNSGYCYVFFNRFSDSFNNMEIIDA